jgi:hypothetical protein
MLSCKGKKFVLSLWLTRSAGFGRSRVAAEYTRGLSPKPRTMVAGRALDGVGLWKSMQMKTKTLDVRALGFVIVCVSLAGCRSWGPHLAFIDKAGRTRGPERQIVL